MSLFVDIEFVTKLSCWLRNFKKKADCIYTASCPICGDSKKKKYKTRGYFYRYKDKLLYKCHNCGISLNLGEFIKRLDSALYKEYVYESYLDKGQAVPKSPKITKKSPFKKNSEYRPVTPSALAGCPSINSLEPTHPARSYIAGRLIPEEFWSELYWTDDFPSVVTAVCPGHCFALVSEGRIIIPFLDRNRQLMAIQGRALGDTGVRYITIKTSKDAPRIFGMHRLSLLPKRVYLVEGPFDSLFLPNCLAMAGGDLPDLPKDITVVIYDNEPRKSETVEKIRHAIDDGWTVCIWPDTVTEKDINAMIWQDTNQKKFVKSLTRIFTTEQWLN